MVHVRSHVVKVVADRAAESQKTDAVVTSGILA